MKPTVKVSWSGGKDSTCAVLLHLEAGHKVKAVNYTPMFTAEIPLLLKEHYEFIQSTAERFRTIQNDGSRGVHGHRNDLLRLCSTAENKRC